MVFAGGFAQHVAQLFFDGVGQHQAPIPPQQRRDRLAFIVEPLAALQEEPAFAPTESAKRWTAAKQHLTANLVDSLAGAFHDVEGVVHDRDVLKVWIGAHGVREGRKHVHRERVDLGLVALVSVDSQVVNVPSLWPKPIQMGFRCRGC
jgi:hypothetical protein